MCQLPLHQHKSSLTLEGKEIRSEEQKENLSQRWQQENSKPFSTPNASAEQRQVMTTKKGVQTKVSHQHLSPLLPFPTQQFDKLWNQLGNYKHEYQWKCNQREKALPHHSFQEAAEHFQPIHTPKRKDCQCMFWFFRRITVICSRTALHFKLLSNISM